MHSKFNKHKLIAALINPSWDSSTHSALTRMGSKLKCIFLSIVY